MRSQIDTFKQHVKEASANPDFLHHHWFVKWHLEVVERLALELCDHYPEADRDLVELLAWLHDYGKIIDFNDQYATTLTAGREKLLELGFAPEVAARAVEYVELMDKKLEVDLHSAPIEVQIVSSADGCSHMVGPFYRIFWNDGFDMTFSGRSLEDRLKGDLAKVEKDWKYKIVLPEARQAFRKFYEVQRVENGQYPDKFFGGATT